jgi:RasGEF domain
MRKTKEMAVLENLNLLMSSDNNYATLRTKTKRAVAPVIPFLGYYLSSFSAIDTLPKMRTQSTDVKLINFLKYAQIANISRELTQFQTPSYRFQRVEEINAYILDRLEQRGDHSEKRVEEHYQTASLLEPKSRSNKSIFWSLK